MKYFLTTFGCAANEADSERIKSYYESRGFKAAKSINEADCVVINTCMVRESAENRVYGLINNLNKLKIPTFVPLSGTSSSVKTSEDKSAGKQNSKLKIILTGCMVGMAVKDKTGKMLRIFKKRTPFVDEFLPIEEVGFEYPPVRNIKKRALVPISNGCNNFCTYCVVPYTRGKEVSRPFDDIVNEVEQLVKVGFTEILLVGQNVNSYGADLVLPYLSSRATDPPFGGEGVEGSLVNTSSNKLRDSSVVPLPRNDKKVVFVKHLGKYRIPTLFPYLLETLCKIKGLKKIDFISSNPWDFSEELIDVIAANNIITRNIHLPVQSGDNEILKKMNRWYTHDEYLKLVANLKLKIKNLKLSTDIIVGFPGETKEQFKNTVDLCKKVGFYKAYISEYSDRPMTIAHKTLKDDVSHKEKKRRWRILEKMINHQK